MPAAAATAAGFLAPDFFASSSTFLKRAPEPNFALAIFLMPIFSGFYALVDGLDFTFCLLGQVNLVVLALVACMVNNDIALFVLLNCMAFAFNLDGLSHSFLPP